MKKIVLLFLLFAFTGTAQNYDLGNWLIYFGNKKLNDKWNWHHEVQYRNYNALGDLEQLLFRTGLGYNLTENNNNILFGYAYVHNRLYVDDTDEKIYMNDHRIYQQFITRQQFSRVFLQHRYRIEERFFGRELRVRFRYFLSVNIPLNHPEMVDNTYYLSAYNEIFLNAQPTVFDRNRIFVGTGYRLNRIARFELGYMYQFLPMGDRSQINIISFINF